MRLGSVLRRLGRLLRVLAIALAGAVAAALAGGVVFLDSKPDLSLWHEVHLDEEFTADAPVADFGAYLALEDRVFDQLDREIRDRLPPEDRTSVNRFHAGSLSDPETWPRNWNRSYELPAEDPPFGVLLLHGYSDSPYSLRAVALALHGRGAHVLGLRVPGHGTAPSGLSRTTVEDMTAAVRLAAAHLAARLDGRPLFLVGYSNGAALALDHAVAAAEDPSLPRPAGLVFLSPEIAVTPAAAAAIWQERVGRLLGLDKLAWNTVLPEYDPYKYGSFAINAGVQSRRITLANQAGLDRLARAGRIGELPPVLAFQSAVDATVVAPALARRFFDRLEGEGHRMVIYDMDRSFAAKGLLKRSPDLEPFLAGPPRAYDVSVFTNRAPDTDETVRLDRPAGADRPAESPTGVAWPPQAYSLSHLALPFPRDDPLYGAAPPEDYAGIRLGTLELRGESGVLGVPAATLARMRWNPFHALMLSEIEAFMDRESARAP